MDEEEARKRMVHRKRAAWNVYRQEQSESYHKLQDKYEKIKMWAKEMREDAYNQYQLDKEGQWITLQVALILAQREYDEATGKKTAMSLKSIQKMR